MPEKSRAKPTTAVLTVAVVLVVTVGFAGVEGLTRVIFTEPLGAEVLYASNYMLTFDEILGWRHNADVFQRVRNTEGQVVTYRTNSYGFRGAEPAEKAVDVLFVGDSMTFGLNGPTAFPEEFSILSGRTAINAGVRGYGTDQSFLMMRRAIDELQFRPRYVVYGFYFNDLINNVFDANIHMLEPLLVHKPRLNLKTNTYDRADWIHNDITRLVTRPDALSLMQELVMRSKFLRAAARVVKYDIIGYTDVKRQNPINKTSLEYLERNLDKFVEYSRARGIDFVLLHVPSIMEPAPDLEIGAFLKRYAQAKQIPYLRPELTRDDYLRRDLHLSAAGATKVAAAVAAVAR